MSSSSIGNWIHSWFQIKEPRMCGDVWEVPCDYSVSPSPKSWGCGLFRLKSVLGGLLKHRLGNTFTINLRKLNEKIVSYQHRNSWSFHFSEHCVTVQIRIRMSTIDLRNWDAYYFSFNQTFAFLDADWTDPKRFPKGKYNIFIFNILLFSHIYICVSINQLFEKIFNLDNRDKNGFWVPYKCHSVWGHFQCPVEPCCSWQSHDVQVDLMVKKYDEVF